MTLQFNDQMFSTLIITIFLILLCVIVGRKVKKLDPLGKTPLWLVPFISLVDLINNFCKESLGKKRYKVYAPYILTLAMYLFFANTASIFLLTPPTSYIVINFALALISFFIIQITGIVTAGKEYFKDFLGPVKPLSPLMLPINIIGELALPVSLSFRLFGNILSGVVISKLVLGVFGWLSLPAVPILNLLFDLTFGTIQVIVFVLLTVIFASMKIPEEDI